MTAEHNPSRTALPPHVPARSSGHIGARRPVAVAASVAVMVTLLAACGAKGDKPSQVAAKVNKEEISVHQINYLMQRTPGITADTSDAASRQILDGLVLQELAVQKALELKLDRNPNVVQSLEAAKRDVLARAFTDTLGEGVAKPTPDEIAAFYSAKPALFKDRRVYTFQEVSIAGTPQQMAEVDAKLKTVKSVQEFADYLKQTGLRHSGKLSTQPAENLPLELLDRFAKMQTGESMFLPQPGGAKALLLVVVKAEPVDQATATPAIERFLLNDRKRLKIEADMKALRANAKIEYVGKFATAAASAPTAPAAVVAPAPAASGLSNDDINKGLSGLK